MWGGKIVCGYNWYATSMKYISEGLIPWYDFYPEWGNEIINNNVFYYEKIKKRANANKQNMGDYFKMIALYKPILAVYGNCQSEFIANLLNKSSYIRNKYIICKFPWIQKIEDEKQTGFDINVMNQLSLFIHMHVERDNVFGEKLSTDAFLKLLNKDCIKITIPFSYFNGYFPQYMRNYRNDDLRRGEGHVPYGDKKINDYLEAGYDIDGVVTKLKSSNLFSQREILDNLNDTIQELQKREKKSDIKISDFIIENYKKRRLFYTPSHPTNYLLAEVVGRILDFLGVDRELEEYNDLPENDTYEMFIYPCVKKELELEFAADKFVLCKWQGGKKKDLKGYVEEYEKFCFPERNPYLATELRNINVSSVLELEEITSFRRMPVVRISGRVLHLALYLTMNKLGKGTILKIKKEYAPKYSYILYLYNLTESKIYPATMYPSGEMITNINVKKGTVIGIDTTWIF